MSLFSSVFFFFFASLPGFSAAEKLLGVIFGFILGLSLTFVFSKLVRGHFRVELTVERCFHNVIKIHFVYKFKYYLIRNDDQKEISVNRVSYFLKIRRLSP
jgi:hypothetical protein